MKTNAFVTSSLERDKEPFIKTKKPDKSNKVVYGGGGGGGGQWDGVLSTYTMVYTGECY